MKKKIKLSKFLLYIFTGIAKNINGLNRDMNFVVTNIRSEDIKKFI